MAQSLGDGIGLEHQWHHPCGTRGVFNGGSLSLRGVPMVRKKDNASCRNVLDSFGNPTDPAVIWLPVMLTQQSCPKSWWVNGGPSKLPSKHMVHWFWWLFSTRVLMLEHEKKTNRKPVGRTTAHDQPIFVCKQWFMMVHCHQRCILLCKAAGAPRFTNWWSKKWPSAPP